MARWSRVVVGEGHEGADSEWAGPRGSAGSIGPGILTAPPSGAPPACRRTGRPGRPRGSRRGAAERGHRLPGSASNAAVAAATRLADRCRRQRRDRGDVLVPGREILRPEPVGHDAHPEVGHVERRVRRVRRHHERQPDRRLPQQRPVRLEVELAERLASASRARGRPADAAVRPTRPPSRSRRRGRPSAEPVDDQRERVARRLGPAVRDDPSLATARRLREERPETRVDPRLERERLGEVDALAPRGTRRAGCCSRRRSSGRLRCRATGPAPTGPTTGRSPARSPGRGTRRAGASPP